MGETRHVRGETVDTVALVPEKGELRPRLINRSRVRGDLSIRQAAQISSSYIVSCSPKYNPNRSVGLAPFREEERAVWTHDHRRSMPYPISDRVVSQHRTSHELEMRAHRIADRMVSLSHARSICHPLGGRDGGRVWSGVRDDRLGITANLGRAGDLPGVLEGKELSLRHLAQQD